MPKMIIPKKTGPCQGKFAKNRWFESGGAARSGRAAECVKNLVFRTPASLFKKPEMLGSKGGKGQPKRACALRAQPRAASEIRLRRFAEQRDR
jgi:hypothetical protein